MTNWKTSVIGIVFLVLGVALFYTGKITWEQLLIFVGLGGLGVAAKDHDVTGGTRGE